MAAELDGLNEPSKVGKTYPFLWAVVLLLLTGACLASWIGSFYIIGHPEAPRCYRILKKLKRLESPKRFVVTEAPQGHFLSAKKIFDQYASMTPAQLAKENAQMLRGYLMNYRETKKPVCYIIGKFDVVESYPLGLIDFLPTGVVSLSQSEDFPQVLLEQILPAEKKNEQEMLEVLNTGTDIRLQRSQDLYALLHVERLDDGRMHLSAVSLPYTGWRRKSGQGAISLKSPEELKVDINIDGGLPVVRGNKLTQALTAYADYRKQMIATTSEESEQKDEVQLIREDEPEDETKVTPAPAPTPPPVKAPQMVSRFPTRPNDPKTDAPAAKMIPVPPPVVPPPPPKAQPVVKAPTPPEPEVPPSSNTPPPPEPGNPALASDPNAPKALPLKPFNPSKRILTVKEASELVGNFKSPSPAFLSGDFMVTAVSGQRVALRSRDSLKDPAADPTKPGSTAALVVVDFPPNETPPPKDTLVTQVSTNGLRIKDVIRGKNGQVTIITERTRK